MTELDFVASIQDDPADPFPRLAFADWLYGRGKNEEAEYLRQSAEKCKQFTKSHSRYDRYEGGVNSLLGAVLVKAESNGSEVHFETIAGDKYKLYHDQD